MFTLARDLSKSVGELHEMDASELMEWSVLYDLEAGEQDGTPEKKRVVSDPAEIRAFFNQHGG